MEPSAAGGGEIWSLRCFEVAQAQAGGFEVVERAVAELMVTLLVYWDLDLFSKLLTNKVMEYKNSNGTSL